MKQWTKEEMAQADRCDAEKVAQFYPWMLYQDPPEKQQWKEPNDDIRSPE